MTKDGNSVTMETTGSPSQQDFWIECFSRRRNKPYYFNPKSGQSVWEKPAHLRVKHDVLKSRAAETREMFSLQASGKFHKSLPAMGHKESGQFGAISALSSSGGQSMGGKSTPLHQASQSRTKNQTQATASPRRRRSKPEGQKVGIPQKSFPLKDVKEKKERISEKSESKESKVKSIPGHKSELSPNCETQSGKPQPKQGRSPRRKRSLGDEISGGNNIERCRDSTRRRLDRGDKSKTQVSCPALGKTDERRNTNCNCSNTSRSEEVESSRKEKVHQELEAPAAKRHKGESSSVPENKTRKKRTKKWREEENVVARSERGLKVKLVIPETTEPVIKACERSGKVPSSPSVSETDSSNFDSLVQGNAKQKISPPGKNVTPDEKKSQDSVPLRSQGAKGHRNSSDSKILAQQNQKNKDDEHSYNDLKRPRTAPSLAACDSKGCVVSRCTSHAADKCQGEGVSPGNVSSTDKKFIGSTYQSNLSSSDAKDSPGNSSLSSKTSARKSAAADHVRPTVDQISGPVSTDSRRFPEVEDNQPCVPSHAISHKGSTKVTCDISNNSPLSGKTGKPYQCSSSSKLDYSAASCFTTSSTEEVQTLREVHLQPDQSSHHKLLLTSGQLQPSPVSSNSVCPTQPWPESSAGGASSSQGDSSQDGTSQMEVDFPSENKDVVLVIVDTNIFIHDLTFLRGILGKSIPGVGDVVIVVPWIVLRELDGLKGNSLDSKNMRSAAARKAVDFLHRNRSNPLIKGQSYSQFVTNTEKRSDDSTDDRILQYCLHCKQKYTNRMVVLLTNDKNLSVKASFSHVPSCGSQNFMNEIQQQLGVQHELGLSSDDSETSIQKPDRLKPDNLHQKEENFSISSPSSEGPQPKERWAAAPSLDEDMSELMYVEDAAGNPVFRYEKDDGLHDNGKLQKSETAFSHFVHLLPDMTQASTEDKGVKDVHTSHTEHHVQSDDKKMDDSIKSKMMQSLQMVLALFLRREMEESYTNHWLDIVYRKPPWSLLDVLQSLRKHFMAVFGLILGRQRKTELTELIKVVESAHDHEEFTPSQMSSFLCSAKSILSVLSKNPKYKGVTSQCKEELENHSNLWKSNQTTIMQPARDTGLEKDYHSAEKHQTDLKKESVATLTSVFPRVLEQGIGDEKDSLSGGETAKDGDTCMNAKRAEEGICAGQTDQAEGMVISPDAAVSPVPPWIDGGRRNTCGGNHQGADARDVGGGGRGGGGGEMDRVTCFVLSIFESIWNLLKEHRDTIVSSLQFLGSSVPVEGVPTKEQSLDHLGVVIPLLQRIIEAVKSLTSGVDITQLVWSAAVVNSLQVFIDALKIDVDMSQLTPAVLQQFVATPLNRERLCVGSQQLLQLLQQFQECAGALSQ